jgi:hypothetical protein
LGLTSSLVDDVTLRNIRQLPEAEDVLMSSPALSAGERQHKLSLALSVFERLNRGGAEHSFCHAMMAETIGVAGSDEVESILDIMLAEVPTGKPRTTIMVAKARSLYFKGQFTASRAMCDDILQQEDPTSQSFDTVVAARTILGACRLQSMETIDDAFSVRDPFRMVVKYVEHNQPGNKLALAAANFNMGTAEALYAAAVSKFNKVAVPMNSALRGWKHGSTLIANRKSCRLLTAWCHTNMSECLIGMANETGNMDYLKQASENAQTALACYEGSVIKDGLGRTLCLLGICAHKGGQAVTAQGLFASALDFEKETVVGKLAYIETLNAYAGLLDDWEKRENEAESMREKAKSVLMPDGWRHSAVTAGSLWLFGRL